MYSLFITLTGIYLDDEDPDVSNIDNMGAKKRRDLYCITEDGPAKLVKLSSDITTSVSGQSQPYPSNLSFTFGFTRAPNELIITCTAQNVTTKFRVDIIYLELIVDRIILHPNLQLKIERIWKEKPLKYTYNRYMKYYISLHLHSAMSKKLHQILIYILFPDLK